MNTDRMLEEVLEPKTTEEGLGDALKKYFGFDEFRPLQEEVVKAVMSKHDVLAIMPTGAGKSLCYQLPAVLLPGVAVVISPLIALMKDQVDGLNQAGIGATFLNSSLSTYERDERMKDIAQGKYKLLYIAPERFPVSGFIHFFKSLDISLFVVDEAHCISEWGHDFREDYRNLGVLRQHFPAVPIVAMTATATQRVQDDILNQLHLHKDTKHFRASFDRQNLSYSVWPKRGQIDQLLGYLSIRKGDSGIIYCMSRSKTESIAATLVANGHKALPYHAGLERELRAKTQEKFDRDQIDVICATIAFGMGIDKPNVRYVIHYDLPKSIPAYYQETGRAGRDGLPSDCILFFSTGDRAKQMRFIQEKPREEQANAIHELDLLIDLAQTSVCRRKNLLGYFGEEYTASNCGHCDNCLSGESQQSFDGTRIAQMFLSCVVRVKENFGVSHIIDVLRGSNAQKILDFGHHNLSTYGIGKDYSKEVWSHFADELRREGLIRKDPDHFNVLKLTSEGWKVLKNERQVTLSRPKEDPRITTDVIQLPALNQELFVELKNLRARLAEDRNVPAYVIFNDFTLRQMAARIPMDGAAFLAITGVGERKAKEFSAIFLAIIRTFKKSHEDIRPFEDADKLLRRTGPLEKRAATATDTLTLFRSGKNAREIADARKLSVSTINTHLASLIETGEIPSLDRLVDEHKVKPIQAALDRIGDALLAPVKEYLGDGFSYDDLRFVRAFESRGRKIKSL